MGIELAAPPALNLVARRGRPLEAVDANEVLGTVRANLNVAIEEANALVTNDGLPTVWADRTQLGQLLQNLIANAIKFHGGQSPRIHIAVCDRPDEWVIAVKDNGIGIKPEHAKKLFQPFSRLVNGTEYPGTGIGLAIVRKGVERMGGRVGMDSQPGKGSCFWVELPPAEKA